MVSVQCANRLSALWWTVCTLLPPCYSLCNMMCVVRQHTTANIQTSTHRQWAVDLASPAAGGGLRGSGDNGLSDRLPFYGLFPIPIP